MKKFAVAIVTAALIGGAGFAAHADEFVLDLKKIDASTPAGQAAIQLWKTKVADAYCGSLDMPQPLDLVEYRLRCQSNVKAEVQPRIDAAVANEQAALRLKVATR